MAFAIMRAAFGEDHPSTVAVRGNLEALKKDMDRRD